MFSPRIFVIVSVACLLPVVLYAQRDNEPCTGGDGGYCVILGKCDDNDKVSGTCDESFSCCRTPLNMNLCRSRGGECIDVGECGEGPELFREAEDCNREINGKDCCIWLK